jgi:WD40 repeat protein
MPEIPSEIHDDNVEDVKHDLYNCLQQCNKSLHDRSLSPAERLIRQELIESRYLEVLDALRDHLCVSEPMCTDRSTLVIKHNLTREVSRQISLGTRLATNVRSEEDEFESGPPGITFLRDRILPKGMPARLASLYRGEYDQSFERKATFVQNLEKVTFASLDAVYVCFNRPEHMHELHRGSLSVPTGFFSPVTSITVDSSTGIIWVAGDVRIRGFQVDTLSIVDTLYVRKQLVLRSSMTIWGNFVVLGTGNELYCWSKYLSEPDSRSKKDLPAKSGGYAEMSRRMGLNQSQIDWKKGRLPLDDIVTVLVKGDITAICAIGPFLAVASSSYPAIHVYHLDNPKVVAVRLIGHTMGVTRLIGYQGTQLFTGSSDKTIKLWNVSEGVCLKHFERHGGKVTSIGYTESDLDKLQFLFTGGKDHFVRAWDLSRDKSMFLLDVGTDMTPVAISFKPVDQYCELSVMSVSGKDVKKAIDKGAVDNSAQLQVFRFLRPDIVS